MVDITAFFRELPDFMRNAALAGILCSVACGSMGSLAVVNRMVMFAGGIAHAAYGGVGLAFFLALSPFPVILSFSLFMAFLMAFFTLKKQDRADAIIGAIWSGGMAMGIILLDLTPGYNVDLMTYLFGSMVAVPTSELWLMAGMNVLILLALFLFRNQFVLLSYDREMALLKGVPVTFLHFLLVGLMTCAVVITMRAVGLLLVIALFSIPPHMAEKYCRSIWSMMLLSSIFSLVFTICGIWLSYLYNISAGATIILVASIAFGVENLVFVCYKKNRLKKEIPKAAAIQQ